MASLPISEPFGVAKKVALGSFVLLNQITSGNALTCFCLGHCPDFPNDPTKNGTCEAKPGAKCFSAVEEVLDPETLRLVPERTYGCLPPDETGLLQCKGHLVPHLNPTSIACCSDDNYCNLRLSPMYESSPDNEDSNDDFLGAAQIGSMTAYTLLISLTICFVIAVLLIAFMYLKYKKREDSRKKYLLCSRNDPEAALKFYPGTLSDLRDQTSSGSGSGLPLMVQRTIAKQIEMIQPVGKGRYGEVWLARWSSDKIAVKVFFTIEEASWFRETDIYQTVLMRHENILGFIAADIRGTGGTGTQMLLITDYHKHGSLYDFLRLNKIDDKTMLKMAHSTASGLAHLHTEIHGTPGKPAIAHRDIKTRNILVKDDLSCCIADFGLAVRYCSEKNEVDLGAPNTRVGTRRYMAPEVVSNLMNLKNFDSYKQADVYSFGLVLWEICRRTVTGDEHAEFYEDSALPYCEYVTSDPTFEDMESVICKKNLRPSIPERWENSEPLASVSRMIRESWHKDPRARPTALRLKKNLHNIRSNYNNGQIKASAKVDMSSSPPVVQKYAKISNNRHHFSS